MNILDIRDLAIDWQILADELDPEAHPIAPLTDAEREDISEQSAKYVGLCDDLGIDTTPGDLRDYGESYEPTLISVFDFEEYAKDLAIELGLIDSNAGWPTRYIDWKAAAAALAIDYNIVAFDGDEYFIRSV